MDRELKVDIALEVIAVLVRTRTYIRVRELNKKLTSDVKNKQAKKKIMKFMR